MHPTYASPIGVSSTVERYKRVYVIKAQHEIKFDGYPGSNGRQKATKILLTLNDPGIVS